MENIDYWAIAAVAFYAASEIIGMLPIKSNSVIQVLLAIGRRMYQK